MTNSNNLEKCSEIYRDKLTGKYLLICHHCGTDFSSFRTIVEHIDNQHVLITDTDGYRTSELIIKNEILTTDDDEDEKFEERLEWTTADVSSGCGAVGTSSTLEVKAENLAVADNKINTKLRSHESAPESALGNNFTCDICSKSYPTKHKILQHLHVHVNLRLHKCDFCAKRFNTRYSINSHLKAVHPDEFEKYLLDKRHKCDYCEEQFTNKKIRQLHMRTEHLSERISAVAVNRTKREVTSHKCEICGKVLEKLYFFQIHMASHENLREHKCPICNDGFNSKYVMKNHLKSHQDGHKCKYCGSADFINWRTLKEHIKLVHSKEKHYKCDLCEKSFYVSNSLKKHKKFYHEGERPFQCWMCGLGFSDKTIMDLHIRRHTGKKDFKCATCDKQFYSLGYLNNHARVHTDLRPFKCNVCGRDFKCNKTLKKHKFIHQGKQFKCSFCDRRFTQMTGKRTHEKRSHIVDN